MVYIAMFQHLQPWILISTICGFFIFGLISIFLTLIGLPGLWLMILTFIALKWWQPDWISWWIIIIAVVIALIAEWLEFIAGAAGSSKAGGSKRASVGAIVGGIVGAIAGAAFPPIIGALLWGAVGAGLGAILGEITAGRDWKKTLPVGTAAAKGKMLGTLWKTALAVVVYLLFLGSLIVP